MRVETGAVKFGNDWTGLFIRGDHALGYSNILRMIQQKLIPLSELSSLIQLLESVQEGKSKGKRQEFKSVLIKKGRVR